MALTVYYANLSLFGALQSSNNEGTASKDTLKAIGVADWPGVAVLIQSWLRCASVSEYWLDLMHV